MPKDELARPRPASNASNHPSMSKGDRLREQTRLAQVREADDATELAIERARGAKLLAALNTNLETAKMLSRNLELAAAKAKLVEEAFW